jgi:ribosomal protein S13
VVVKSLAHLEVGLPLSERKKDSIQRGIRSKVNTLSLICHKMKNLGILFKHKSKHKTLHLCKLKDISQNMLGTLSAIMGIGTGLASIYGAIKGNQNRKKAEKLYDEQFQELEDWRNTEQATDYLQRADAQDILRQVAENNDEYLRGMDNDAIRSGATAESKVAAAAKANENYARVASSLAAQGQAHKDNVEQIYQQGKQNRDAMKIANLTDTSAIQSMISGMASAAGAMGNIYALSSPTTTTPTTTAEPLTGGYQPTLPPPQKPKTTY